LVVWYRLRHKPILQSVKTTTHATETLPATKNVGLTACDKDMPFAEKTLAVYHAINEWQQQPTHHIESMAFQQNWQQLKAHLFNQQPISEEQLQQLCESVKAFKPEVVAASKQKTLEPIYPK